MLLPHKQRTTIIKSSDVVTCKLREFVNLTQSPFSSYMRNIYWFNDDVLGFFSGWGGCNFLPNLCNWGRSGVFRGFPGCPNCGPVVFRGVPSLFLVLETPIQNWKQSNWVIGKKLQCVNTEKLVLTYLPNHRISKRKQQNHRIRRLIFSSAGFRSWDKRGGQSSRSLDKGEGGLQKKVWSQNKGGPGDLPWIRHCLVRSKQLQTSYQCT